MQASMKARRKWFSKKKKTKTKKQKTKKQNKKTNKQTNKQTNKLNSRDNYLCVIITLSPNRGRTLIAKPNEKNNNK